MIDLWLDDERDPDDRLIQEMFDSFPGMLWVKTAFAAGAVGYGISSSAMIEIHAPAAVKVHGGEVIRLDQAAAGECAEHVLRPDVAE